MNLEIKVENHTEKTSVILAGEIDAFTAPKLKETLLPVTKEAGHIVEVDMENVNYMDSTGLGIFVSALKSTKENNSDMRLVQLQDRVYRLFEITGLTDIITIDNKVQGGS